MTQIKRKRGPGRPAGRDASVVRRRLLDAAREICVEVGLDAASVKAIAARAGVNPAMISYYFDGKEGLGRAMMSDAIAPLIERLDAVDRAGGTVRLEDFMRAYMRTVAANPWLPRLVVREVLPVNGRFRAMFLEELASRAAKHVLAIVDREIRDGRMRDDVDPRLALLSMVSLAIFPFLATPIIEPVFGIDMRDEPFLNSLVEHSVSMLRRALQPGVKP